MKKLPDPKTYEEELKFMPYKESLAKVIDILCAEIPENGNMLDSMCGPGYLLGKIAVKRPDLNLEGVDIDKKYIKYARENYKGINFKVGDILSWKPKRLFNVVVCTGALHHIPYEKQEFAIARISDMIKVNGFCIISDCYVGDYRDETERKLAAAKLGYEYLKETIKNKAPLEVIAATIDILHNDVMGFEFKTSLRDRLPVFERYFRDVEVINAWTGPYSCGDYIAVCRHYKKDHFLIKE